MKRSKRLAKVLENLKKRIEEHFEKLEENIKEGNKFLAEYHAKKIDKSLIDDLEYKMELLGGIDAELLENYRKRLGELGGGLIIY